jgi:hypothetical protein
LPTAVRSLTRATVAGERENRPPVSANGRSSTMSHGASTRCDRLDRHDGPEALTLQNLGASSWAMSPCNVK